MSDPRIAHRRRTLPCGLDVIVHADPAAPQICVNVTYKVGSSDERADRTGFAHLFEHLFKQPPERFGGHHHYDVLKRAGATEANASTSTERTAYHEVVPANQLPLALWIESDRMGYFERGFTTDRLAQQQAVVRQERRQRYEDVPYGAERFAIGRGLYADGHPLRNLTIGLHDDIQAATLDDALAFYRTWYVPANATLVLAGDVPPDVDAQVDRWFGSFPHSARPVRPAVTPSVPAAATETVSDPFAALVRIHRAWRAPAAFADDEPALDLLASAWTTTGTGTLWRRLVYDAPLAQRISAWSTNGRLGGEFHIAVDLRTGTDPALVRSILDDECTRGATDAAIARSVTRREAGAIWSLAQLSKRASTLQRYALYDLDPDGLSADLARYRTVTAAAIDAARARWLTPASMVEVTTLPATPPS